MMLLVALGSLMSNSSDAATAQQGLQADDPQDNEEANTAAAWTHKIRLS